MAAAETDQRAKRRLSRSVLLTTLVLAGLVAGAAGIAWYIWNSLQGVVISPWGLTALIAGATVTVLLGVGLMSLVFVSNRRGYDDDAGRD